MNKILNIKILEAITLIAESTDQQVSYEVKHSIDKEPFRKTGVKKTFITIEITEPI